MTPLPPRSKDAIERRTDALPVCSRSPGRWTLDLDLQEHRGGQKSPLKDYYGNRGGEQDASQAQDHLAGRTGFLDGRSGPPRLKRGVAGPRRGTIRIRGAALYGFAIVVRLGP